jgi:small subunit ribosomal protein S1
VEDQGINAVSLEGGGASQAIPSMSDLLDQDFSRIVPERGDVIEGIIVSKEPSEIVIDIGCKSEGVVSSRDLERLEPEFVDSLNVGDSVHVYVLRPEGRDGNAVLSLSRARLESDWKSAEELFEAGEVFESEVVSSNRGGLIVNVGRVRGFIPASQVSSVRLSRDMDEETRQEVLSGLLGQNLHLKIIEIDRRRNRLILSERVAIREWRQQQKDRLLDRLTEGETRQGTVSSLCDFGAFVDLGGADGLVHLSELSWGRIGHPREVLRIGQKVDVYVLGVDRERRRIALSLKRLKPEPWSTVEDRYEVGQLVTGTITKVTDFGAFARLDEDIEGLIHISELSDDRIAHPSAVVHEGEELQLRIIRLDPDRQRLGLSLRRVSEDSYFGDYDWQESGQIMSVEDSTEENEEQ